jgi:hypothetical protein
MMLSVSSTRSPGLKVAGEAVMPRVPVAPPLWTARASAGRDAASSGLGAARHQRRRQAERQGQQPGADSERGGANLGHDSSLTRRGKQGPVRRAVFEESCEVNQRACKIALRWRGVLARHALTLG